MNVQKLMLTIAALITAVTVYAGAPPPQSFVAIDGDDIVFRGCIRRVDPSVAAPSILVWGRSDIMLAAATALGANASNPVGTSGVLGRVFYWLDDDDSLANHIGQLVEVKGDLKDFETAEVKIDRDDGFTEIEVKLDGHKEKARIPTAWWGVVPDDQEFDIVTRRIDVDKVRVLGACAM